MSDATSTTPAAADVWGRSGRRPTGYGLGVFLLVLLAVAVATAVLVPWAQGRPVTWATWVATYDWLVTVVVVVTVVALMMWLMRLVAGPSGGRRARLRERRGRREEAEVVGGNDAAVSIARQRYARGEISSEQLQQILTTLEKGPARGAVETTAGSA